MTLPTLSIDPVAWSVEADGLNVRLSYSEFRLLLFLAENPRMAFTREELARVVWGPDGTGQLKMIDLYIHRLRRKLGNSGRVIHTVHRVGYRFEVSGAVQSMTPHNGIVGSRGGGQRLAGNAGNSSPLLEDGADKALPLGMASGLR